MKTKKLPQGWKEVELGEITLVDSGQGAPQGEKFFGGDKLFVRAGDLNNLTGGIYVGNFCGKITDEAIKKYKLKLYKKGSIVFPKSGMSVLTGNIAILKEDSYIVNHLAIIEPSKDTNNLFLFYLFKKIGVENLTQNNAYPSIRISDIKDLKIPLPPLETQKKIVAVLEKAESLKEKRKRALEHSDDYLKSLFYEMFLKEKDKLAIAKLENYCIQIIDIEHKMPKAVERGVPFLSAKDVVGSKINFDNVKTISEEDHLRLNKRCNPEESDILYSRIGSIGVAKRIKASKKFSISYSLILIKPDHNKINNIFLEFALNSDFVFHQAKSHTRGIGVPDLNMKTIKNLKIPLPPLDLQKKFASIVEKVEKLKEKQAKSRDEIDELFNSLMQRAFRGELV